MFGVVTLVLFVGELLADLITNEELTIAENFTLKLGGSPGNIAKYLRQLGKGARMLSRVGKDLIGKRLVGGLGERGVDVRFVQFDEEHGTSLVFVRRSTRSPDFFVVRGADRFLEEPVDEILDGVKIVHFSCWPFTSDPSRSVSMGILQKAKELGIKFGFDPNCRPELFPDGRIDSVVIDTVLSFADYVKPSLDDASALFTSLRIGTSTQELARYFIDEFKRRGVRNIALTAGHEGAFVHVEGGTSEIVHLPSVAAKVVDVTGAGDGFWAGIYLGLLEGLSFEHACMLGNLVAAQVVGKLGADVELDVWSVKNSLEKFKHEGGRVTSGDN